MPWIDTQLLSPDQRLAPDVNQQVYCGLDSCLTIEVFEEITRSNASKSLPTNDFFSSKIYNFERALQAPYLEIMQRGFAIDELGRRQASESLRHRINNLQQTLDELAGAAWGRGLNPRSPQQLKDFFYGAMRLPEIQISQKGVRRVSTNREALEKLDQYLYARPFVSTILLMRDLGKQLSVLETEIDSDGRMRTSYNIAGTESGRPSSSENAFGTGTNLQNISPLLRYVFVADPGWKLCVIDLEQVEARDVGFFMGCLFDDWTFLDSCESGDLHTNNAKLIWPELPWTGDAKADRAIADKTFYRDFSYRDMAKRGSHLSNYSGTAWTAARSLKVPLPIMEEFQARYVRGRLGGIDRNGRLVTPIEPAYPGIARYWQWIAQQLQTTQRLVTPFGRERQFFGRPGDDTTLREAIAFLPQSTTADRMNLGLWRVWHKMPQVQLLGQTFDSITFQYRESADEAAIIEQALELIRVELRAPNGRQYVVPGEAKIGWNWGSQFTESDQANALKLGKRPPRLNLDGLIKYKRSAVDSRRRQVGLERRMYSPGAW